MSDCPLVGCTDVYSVCDLCGEIARVFKDKGLYRCVELVACRLRREAA